MKKINQKQDKTETVTGIITIDGKSACEKCKTKNPKIKSKMFMGLEGGGYIQEWKCCKCGNIITMNGNNNKEG